MPISSKLKAEAVSTLTAAFQIIYPTYEFEEVLKRIFITWLDAHPNFRMQYDRFYNALNQTFLDPQLKESFEKALLAFKTDQKLMTDLLFTNNKLSTVFNTFLHSNNKLFSEMMCDFAKFQKLLPSDPIVFLKLLNMKRLLVIPILEESDKEIFASWLSQGDGKEYFDKATEFSENLQALLIKNPMVKFKYERSLMNLYNKDFGPFIKFLEEHPEILKFFMNTLSEKDCFIMSLNQRYKTFIQELSKDEKNITRLLVNHKFNLPKEVPLDSKIQTIKNTQELIRDANASLRMFFKTHPNIKPYKSLHSNLGIKTYCHNLFKKIFSNATEDKTVLENDILNRYKYD